MADPITVISLVASVLSLADYSARLSVKLFSVSKQIRNAPKAYEALSHEVAITSTILQQLGAELEHQCQSKIYKPAAISTTQSLIEECQDIFNGLTDIAEPKIKKDAGSTAKAITEWKNRLKFPYQEAEINAKRARLEQLKASLNVVLNVLILAAQVKVYDKSEEAGLLLREQHAMLKYLKRGMDVLSMAKKSSASLPPNCPTLVSSMAPISAVLNSNPSEVLARPGIPSDAAVVASAGSLTTTSSIDACDSNPCQARDRLPLEPGDLEGVPEGIRPYVVCIREHARLVDDLITTIKKDSYHIARRTRTQMRKGTYDLHCQIWAELSRNHNFYDMEHVLSEFDDLAERWSIFVAKEEISLQSRIGSQQTLVDAHLAKTHDYSEVAPEVSKTVKSGPSRQYLDSLPAEQLYRSHRDDRRYRTAFGPQKRPSSVMSNDDGSQSRPQSQSIHVWQSQECHSSTTDPLHKAPQEHVPLPATGVEFDQEEIEGFREVFNMLKNEDGFLDVNRLPELMRSCGEYVPDLQDRSFIRRTGVECIDGLVDFDQFLQIVSFEDQERESVHLTDETSPRRAKSTGAVDEQVALRDDLPVELETDDGNTATRIRDSHAAGSFAASSSTEFAERSDTNRDSQLDHLLELFADLSKEELALLHTATESD